MIPFQQPVFLGFENDVLLWYGLLVCDACNNSGEGAQNEICRVCKGVGNDRIRQKSLLRFG